MRVRTTRFLSIAVVVACASLVFTANANAIPGPWGAGERVLVCISEDPRAAGLVRYSKRLADRLHAPWTALTVETPRSAALGEIEREGHLLAL